MFTINSFYNKEKYISPEDEIKIYYEVFELMKIWKNIILVHSNDRITDLSRENQEILSNIIPYLENIKLNNTKAFAPQLDKQIVRIMLWGASSFLPNQSIVDEVYKKTKSSMFQYFHHDLLINAYLKLNKANEALQIIKYMFEKDHSAYFYAISKYDVANYTNKEFIEGLKEYKSKIDVKLLSKGETVNLSDVSFYDLLELVDKVKKDIGADLAR